MYRSSFVLMLAALLASVAEVRAQEARLPLRVGNVARVTAPEAPGGRVVGRVRIIDRDSLVLRVSGPVERVGLAIPSIEVAELGIGRSRVEGALIGTGAGLLGGVVLGLACTFMCVSDSGPNMFVAAGILLGPPAGLVLGAVFPPRRWARLPLPKR